MIDCMVIPDGELKKVAIIGGGISGLSCAQSLSESLDVTVYDTGRLRPGGRCSSRFPFDPIKQDEKSKSFPSLLEEYRFDHAAQLIELQNNYPEFSQQMMEWKDKGIVQELSGGVFKVSKDAEVQPIEDKSFFFGTDGMGNIPLAMMKQCSSFHVEQDTWVSPSSGIQYQKKNGTWKVQAKGKALGYYDYLVIAHNGKCADRLLSKTPAKDVHSLLRVNFSPTVPAHGGKKMTLNSLYSLTLVIPSHSTWSKKLPSNFVCGFMDHPKLSMLTCQTKKYLSDNDKYEVWTILSSSKFAKQHKAPQEFLPVDVIDEVKGLLIKAVQESLNIDDTESDVLDYKLQLWGAAVPLNVWENDQGFIYDADYSIGVVGDWLVEPSIAGAWTSGYRLGEYLKRAHPIAITSGLEGNFVRSESTKVGIAAMPRK
jgi:predicted NAD/FAD-dependent oxidoreductase